MSTRSSSDDSWIVWVVIAILGVGAYVVWQFSTFFGLDINTGGSVLLRMVGLAGLIAGSWKLGDDIDLFRLGNVWPILLGLLWGCWWPALDYWAAQQMPSFLQEEATVWWDAWYTQWGVLVAIIGVGYLIRKICDD